MREAGREGTYEAIRVRAGEGAREIARLHALGYSGLNVTTPLKEEAFAAAARCDPSARAARAVNTILFSGPEVLGANTDGIGAREAIDALAGNARRILLLGASATARAAAVALGGGGRELFVWNRTAERAAQFARALGVREWRSGEAAVDVVLSTLLPEATLDEDVTRAIRSTRVVIDANYGERATLGQRLGRFDVHDGSAMLQASARASFRLFIGALL